MKEYYINVVSSYRIYDIVKEIISVYVSGANIIKIYSKDVKREVVVSAIYIARDKLMGLEIVDEVTILYSIRGSCRS